MATAETKLEQTRGAVWHQFSAGDPIESPMAEWAYITPSHPEGIPGSQLRAAQLATQLETARYWFLLNYEPYRLPPGTYFGFSSESSAEVEEPPAGFAPDLDTSFGSGPVDSRSTDGGYGRGAYGASGYGGARESASSDVRIGGWDQGTFAPSPLRAGELLRRQFGGTLSDEAQAQLADELGDDWIERDRREPTPAVSTEASPTVADMQANILTVTNLMRDQLRALSVLPLNFGHNEAGGQSFVTLDTTAFMMLLDRAGDATRAGNASGAQDLIATSEQLKHFGAQAGKESERLSELFTKGLAEEAGKETAKLIADGFRVLSRIFFYSALLGSLIAAFGKHFGL